MAMAEVRIEHLYRSIPKYGRYGVAEDSCTPDIPFEVINRLRRNP
jgi:hypothetical protein